MFTGIITDIGTVTRVIEGDKTRRIFIRTNLDLSPIAIGASIACDGCCQTVVEKSGDTFAVDAVAETLAKTSLNAWQENTRINLELSLKLGDEMGGHMVSGHVDALAKVVSITPDGVSSRFTFSVPEDLAHFIAPKGSVTLNGVSLTVNEVEGNTFGVCIIPHTLDVTTFSNLKPDHAVNLEIDMLARYVARMMEQKAA